MMRKRPVSGAATKGPIRGVRVDSYDIDGFGFATGNAIATTKKDDSGNFAVSLPASAEAVLVETSDGSFITEPDQETDPVKKR